MAMNHKVIIKTETAPPAIGPYSQAIKVDQMIFVSGQIPIDKEAKNIVGADIASQTRQCLENIRAILESTGAAMSQVVKTTVYLKDMGDFKQMNEVYKDFFQIDPPARACVEVSKLPGNVLVEIDAIALMPPPPKAVEKGSLL
jgi:2-iminobutanoate/2-iminopropanoate deaminase